MKLASRLKLFPIGRARHILCNGLTGKLLILRDAGLEALERLAESDPATLGWLRNNELLFNSEEEEEARFDAICEDSWREFQISVPRQYTFVVNTHCNFTCEYCFEEAFARPVSTLSRSQIDSAFKIADKFASRAHRRVGSEFEIFGGEPLLPGSRDTVAYILAQLSLRKWRASLQTNGYFLTDYLDLLDERREAISQVQITLDGPRDVHDHRRCAKGGQATFDRIVAGIDALASAGVTDHINIRMNVDRSNVEKLGAMAAVYKEKGWLLNPSFTFVAAPVDNRCAWRGDSTGLLGWHELLDRVFPLSTEAGGGPFDLGVFKTAGYFRYYMHSLSEAKEKRTEFDPKFTPRVVFCEAAALKVFAFHPDGLIYPCPEAIGKALLAVGTYHPEFRINRKQARQWRRQTVQVRGRCRRCAISTFCGGGCVLKALMDNGSMNEPVCENAEEVISGYLEKVCVATD